MNRYRRPRRWVFYLLYVIMVVLLALQAPLHVATCWHQLMEFSIVSGTLVVMAWWKRRIAAALDDEAILNELDQRAGQRRDTPLTAVQAHYLVAQARRTRNDEHGDA